jgi:hypothetical protein
MASTYKLRTATDNYVAIFAGVVYGLVVVSGLIVGDYVEAGALAVFFGWLGYRYVTTKVLAWPENIGIRNVFWTHYIPWSDIDGFSVGTTYSGGWPHPHSTRVHLHDGRIIRADGVAAANLSRKKEVAALHEIVDQLNERLLQSVEKTVSAGAAGSAED